MTHQIIKDLAALIITSPFRFAITVLLVGQVAGHFVTIELNWLVQIEFVSVEEAGNRFGEKPVLDRIIYSFARKNSNVIKKMRNLV